MTENNESDKDPTEKDVEFYQVVGYGHTYDGNGDPRDRGIFTNADREHIIGIREKTTPQGKSNLRSRLVQRITDAMEDFHLLLLLDDRTRERVLTDSPPRFLQSTLRSLIQFYYEGVDRDPEFIENAVSKAIAESETIRGERPILSVSAEISVDKAPNPEKAKEMLERGEGRQLSLEQIGVLVREDLIDPDELDELAWPPTTRENIDQ